MSFGIAAIVASTVLGSIVSDRNASKQRDAQREANRIQQRANEESKQQQIEEMRRNNQQQADLSSILDASTGSDMQSTMVSGIGGVDPTQLVLGRGNSLLGG